MVEWTGPDSDADSAQGMHTTYSCMGSAVLNRNFNILTSNYPSSKVHFDLSIIYRSTMKQSLNMHMSIKESKANMIRVLVQCYRYMKIPTAYTSVYVLGNILDNLLSIYTVLFAAVLSNKEQPVCYNRVQYVSWDSTDFCTPLIHN